MRNRLQPTHRTPHGARPLLAAYDLGKCKLYGHTKLKKGTLRSRPGAPQTARPHTAAAGTPSSARQPALGAPGGGCAAPCAEGKCSPLRSATASTTPRGSARIAVMPRSRGRRGSGGGKSHVCRSPRQWDSERVLFVEYDGPVPRALMARIGEVCGTPVTSRRC
ncbi:hypothetical protein ACE1SV_63250 [Streptomyces sennicomposti]